MLKPRGFQWRGVLSRSGFQDDSFRFSAVPVRTAVSAEGISHCNTYRVSVRKHLAPRSGLQKEGELCHIVGTRQLSSDSGAPGACPSHPQTFTGQALLDPRAFSTSRADP